MNSFLAGNTTFVILIATGLILWAIAIYVKNNQPKSPNSTYGYRTPRSMKSQEAWDFSQEYSINLLIQSAKVLCGLAALSLLVDFSEEVGGYLATILILVAVLFPVLLTERELKKRFDS